MELDPPKKGGKSKKKDSQSEQENSPARQQSSVRSSRAKMSEKIWRNNNWTSAADNWFETREQHLACYKKIVPKKSPERVLYDLLQQDNNTWIMRPPGLVYLARPSIDGYPDGDYMDL